MKMGNNFNMILKFLNEFLNKFKELTFPTHYDYD